MLHDSFLADRVKDGQGWETRLAMELDLEGFGVSDETPDEAWREARAVVDSVP